MIEVTASCGWLKEPGSQHLQYRPRKLSQINMASCPHPFQIQAQRGPGEAHRTTQAPRRDPLTMRSSHR